MTQKSDYRELLIGCGYSREKKISSLNKKYRWLDTPDDNWQNLTTLDSNPKCKPDIVCEIDSLPDEWQIKDWSEHGSECIIDSVVTDPYIQSDYFDEVHAYEILEHIHYQGNHTSFFNLFDSLYRILKPGGILCASVPSRFSPWLWGDPGHRCAILPETLVFLDQIEYTKQCGRTPMSDYRDIYKSDFRRLMSEDDHELHRFVLQAVKPSRISI